MAISRKALYNLLKLAEADGLELPGLQGWELEDYRQFSTEELFSRLRDLGLQLTPESLIAFAEGMRTPEELAEVVIPDGADDDHFDQAYLCLFELWRRLLPERRPQSIFCNELDELVLAWYEGSEHSDEDAQRAIGLLKDLLQDAGSQKHDPETLYAILSEGCAHHLSGFLYDYLREQLDEEESPRHTLEEIQQLIDFFEPFVDDPRWFQLLRVVLLMEKGEDLAAYNLLKSIHQTLSESFDGYVAQELMSEWFCCGCNQEALDVGGIMLDRLELQADAANLLGILALMAEELEEPALTATLENYFEQCAANSQDPVGKELRKLIQELCQRVRQSL